MENGAGGNGDGCREYRPGVELRFEDGEAGVDIVKLLGGGISEETALFGLGGCDGVEERFEVGDGFEGWFS